MNNEGVENLASDSGDLVESRVHEHALNCSKTYRAGKFTRVGQDFIDEVNADVEAMIRELRGKFSTLHPALEQEEPKMLLTGKLKERLCAEFNKAVYRLIQNKVQRQPTTGKTLGRTR